MDDHQILIDALSRSAQAVKRPLSTPLRVAVWVGLALPSGIAASFLLPHGWTDWSRPGAVWPFVSLILSFILGAMAIATGFQLGIAGRKVMSWKSFAPMIVAWLVACGMNIVSSPDPIGRFGSGAYCFSFMTLSSIPMVALAIILLGRTGALQPSKALAVAGLGIAFMTSTLLMLCHSVNEELFDFAMHLLAGGLIVVATVVLGRRWVAV